MSAIELIIPDWPAPSNVRAAFTLRTGGVSAAPCDSLNLGEYVGDPPQSVAENRRRVKAALGLPAQPLWLRQVHGTRVIEIDPHAAVPVQAPEADAALVRCGRGAAALARYVCAVQVADCLPVLFTLRDGSAFAAAHAGWRGLAAGVLESTVRCFARPAQELLAWIGPAISAAHFEVGDEVRAAFVNTDAEVASAFVPNARGRWQCDLAALARQRLRSLGVRQLYGGPWCTFAEPARFFSFRRDGRCGRMAALIWADGEPR